MRRRHDTSLTQKQLEAVRILLYRRHLPTTSKATTHKAINFTTAWGLEEAGLARTYFAGGAIPMPERVKLLPAAKQLVRLGRTMGKVV